MPPPYTHVGAVTGANKGIGLAIVRNIALQYPSSFLKLSSSSAGTTTSTSSTSASVVRTSLLIYLTARDEGRGREAVRRIYEDEELRRRGVLRREDACREGEERDGEDGGSSVTVKFHQLDISDEKSIEGFERFLKQEHEDGIDFLVNNAGIAMNGFDDNVVHQTLRCNYYGTLDLTNRLLPLMKPLSSSSPSSSSPPPPSRVVNLGSSAGSLSKFSPDLQRRFRSARTVPEITSLMQEFAAAVRSGVGNERAAGWPSAAYATSKAGITGMTRALAIQEKSKGRKTLINACCPGYVSTDMTKGRGSSTVDQGAVTPVMLAIGDFGDVTGEHWRHERIQEW